MKYKQSQIDSVEPLAKMFGYTGQVDVDLSIEFLDFYFETNSQEDFWDRKQKLIKRQWQPT